MRVVINPLIYVYSMITFPKMWNYSCDTDVKSEVKLLNKTSGQLDGVHDYFMVLCSGNMGVWELPSVDQSHIDDYTQRSKMYSHTSPLLSLSLSTIFSPHSSSLYAYLPTSIFISLRGTRGACERLVKEHGMLMAWKRI